MYAACHGHSDTVAALVRRCGADCRRRHERGRGSISYLSYFIQGLGCMVVMINMVVNNHDPWTVWMPGFVAGLGQLTIVVLGLGFLCRDRGRPLVAVADGGASLLQ